MWSPSSVGDVLLLESVQRNFTKKIPSLKYKPYFERLKATNLSTLELRRLYADLTFCYKILNGLVAGPPNKCGLTLANRKSRGNSFKLLIEHARVDVRKHFFGHRICGPWNSLPDDVVSASSVASFKRLLSKCPMNNFLMLNSEQDL